MPGLPTTNVTYHYELASDVGALTGKSVNGVRYSTFAYNSSGYATKTEHNGLEKYTLTYSTTGAVLTVVETNPLGKNTTYTFEDEIQEPLQVSLVLIAQELCTPKRFMTATGIRS